MVWDQPNDVGPSARNTTYGRGEGDVPKATVWTEPSLGYHFQENPGGFEGTQEISNKYGPNLNNIAQLGGKNTT